MRRGTTYFLMLWMAVLTLWTGFLALSMMGRAPVSPAYAKTTLDVNDPVTVRWEATLDGRIQQIVPPTTMPLWEYVQAGNQSTGDRLEAFELAFESDLHAKDPTFHHTHELIDGRRW